MYGRREMLPVSSGSRRFWLRCAPVLCGVVEHWRSKKPRQHSLKAAVERRGGRHPLEEGAARRVGCELLRRGREVTTRWPGAAEAARL